MTAAADTGQSTLPAEPDGWDPVEDDRTAEVRRLLRAKRRAHRRQRNRDLAVLVYALVLMAVGYGGGYTYHFLRQVRIGADHGGLGQDIQHALPAAFTLLTLAAGLLAARDARWRGPVVVPGPTVGWLLAQPVRRAAVLRPWLWLSAGLSVLAALLPAAALVALLRATRLAGSGEAALAVLPAAVCLPLLAVALAMAVESRPGWAERVGRWTPLAVALLGLLAVQGWLAVTGRRSGVLERVELWSGPWGWAAQPVLRATGERAAGWPAAIAALLLTTAAAMVAAHRAVPRLSHAQLRRRAATVSVVRAGLWTMEPRTAGLAISEAAGGTVRRQVRLRPPRGRRTVVLWRDTLALLRTPGRLGRAAVWAACASAAAGGAGSAGGQGGVILLVLALALGYAAVSALAEPARLETDDLRRSAWSPLRLRTLMRWHTVLPAALGTLLALLAAVPWALAGRPQALLLMPLCAPPLAAAAVVGACRGPVRTELLFTGIATPAGDPGPALFVLWYLAAPLISIGSLAFALHGAPAGTVDAVTAGRVLAAAAALTGGLLLRAARGADRLVGRGR
ncbi:hypothetical protein [Streptomyces palmae]|uniref:Uncharacterized protein n=1 Tax=Streptomyces palmae TaxID=1701085 RepID=A0A4Z0HGX1_9ACTN|nr:hypothetical protein [Streptomyces palmae]TGB17089.1 hypothetical protein E4099_04105 [Streptomyces palmae]